MPRLRDIGHDMREIFPRSGFGECRRVFILCLETSSTDVEQTLMLASGSGESLSLRAHKLETGFGTGLGSQLGCYSRLPTPTGIESILETTCAHTSLFRCIAPTMSVRNLAYGMACQSGTPAFLRSARGRGMFPRRSRVRIPHPSEARGPLSFKLTSKNREMPPKGGKGQKGGEAERPNSC